MAERSRDWMAQAEADFHHAGVARDAGDYEWAAFAAHQAAEKAIKALFQKQHMEARGHTLAALLGRLPEPVKPDAPLIDRAKELDHHYIPSRYPNAFEQGAPGEMYTLGQAEQAIAHAEAILRFCRDHLD